MPFPSLTHLLKRLRSSEQTERTGALHALRDMARAGLSHDNAAQLLRAAADLYPATEGSPAALVERALQSPHPDHIDVIRRHFKAYDLEARAAALTLLALLPDREAAVALVDLLREYAPGGDLGALAFGPLAQNPRHADVLFPALLEIDALPRIAADLALLALAYLDSGLIHAEDLHPALARCIHQAQHVLDHLRPRQRTDGVAWLWAEDYAPRRREAGIFLDLLGRTHRPEALPVLKSALDMADPRLKLFAAGALLEQGEQVTAAVWEAISASPETRGWAFRQLAHAGQLDLMPDKYRTQAALAEADLVNWLAYPTELGRAPDEIALADVVCMQLIGDVLPFYVFRFRMFPPHPAAGLGWLAGVAGPYPRGAGVSASAGGTFSRFDPFDSATPAEHVDRALETLDRWRKAHDRQNGG